MCNASSPINAAPLLSDVDVEATSATRSLDEPSISLEWRDICAYVKDDKAKASGGMKQVLWDASGEARPGEILAVMGPSGAGKTTLLNILADRAALGDGHWTGSVTLNGQSPPSGWKRSVAYSMQKDIFFDKLTIRDHLECTATCRLPTCWSPSQKRAEMMRVVALLRLEGCLDTVVGSGTDRGLSGGELKRLNIATELLSRPRLLFMDEPFTGLDSSLATAVLDALRNIASESGVTILITVHQPSSAMWCAFDKLLLMAPGGRVAYFGGRDAEASNFFSDSLGLPLPPGWSCPDHYVALVTEEVTRKKVTDAWATRPHMAEPRATSALVPRGQPPLRVAVPALLRRQLKQVRRQYLKPMEWALTLLLASIWGVLWWQIGRKRREPDHQSDYISLIFFFIAQWSWAPLFQVNPHSEPHRLRTAPSPNLTVSPSHPLTRSPAHPLTLSPSHPLTRSPSHPLTLSPPQWPRWQRTARKLECGL